MSVEFTFPTATAAIKLHGFLAREYQKHACTIEKKWISLDRNQRMEYLKNNTKVLRHSWDWSLSLLYRIVPEVNLHDLTQPESNLLLRILKHRATRSL